MSTLRDVLAYEPVELNFGTSGLRGLVVDMTDLECYINTLGFLRFLEEADGLSKGSTVYLAGDLRNSTPRILASVIAAIEQAGYQTVYAGLIPTPALALYSMKHDAPGIMVTGSHIPDDRNGIKFYKAIGEVLKSDEPAIKQAVAVVRADVYSQAATTTPFDARGLLRQPPALPAIDQHAAADFTERYTRVFGPEAFAGKKIVFYQHSAVGRDLLTDLLKKLGAAVVAEGRSEVFIPIDSENVTPEHQAYFTELARKHPDAFAIVSTDGDSDRPFVIDETGQFHRGDVLGAVVAKWLKADFAAVTATTSDAATIYLANNAIEWEQTKIGSPYVVAAMAEGAVAGKKRPVGWEVNGGFMTGTDFVINGKNLPVLPTRDAALPIIVALRAAAEGGQKVSELFAALPARFTSFGQIDNFPIEMARAIVGRYSQDTPETRAELEGYFSEGRGFGPIQTTASIDGVRLYFANGDIAHLRQSGNAPQFRMYTVADTQERADEIVQMVIAEPDGIYRQMQKVMTS